MVIHKKPGNSTNFKLKLIFNNISDLYSVFGENIDSKKKIPF